MIESAAVRWALTVVLSIPVAYHLLHLARSSRHEPETRLSQIAHLLMSASMIAMLWPWGGNIPAWPQAALFAIAGGYFLACALRPMQTEPGSTLDRLHQTVSLWAMAWMLVVMPMAYTADPGGSFTVAHSHHSADRTVIAMPLNPDIKQAIMMITIVLACYFILSTTHLLVTALGHRSKAAAASHGLMNVAMVAMLVMMI
ncbi:DUF5134 domain-containing protein [Pseudonocardiaceae bacterium YIM PH 21723]|nr:DUF5134 domain-containing protein [Pseudonocardiaceae bacterium YIM PH 21723]